MNKNKKQCRILKIVPNLFFAWLMTYQMLLKLRKNV